MDDCSLTAKLQRRTLALVGSAVRKLSIFMPAIGINSSYANGETCALDYSLYSFPDGLRPATPIVGAGRM
jgi:hypothetical protein